MKRIQSQKLSKWHALILWKTQDFLQFLHECQEPWDGREKNLSAEIESAEDVISDVARDDEHVFAVPRELNAFNEPSLFRFCKGIALIMVSFKLAELDFVAEWHAVFAFRHLGWSDYNASKTSCKGEEHKRERMLTCCSGLPDPTVSSFADLFWTAKDFNRQLYHQHQSALRLRSPP